MIPRFTQSYVQCGDVRLSVHRTGQGTPLILLHGTRKTIIAGNRLPRSARLWRQRRTCR